jgi:hypothetical protein
MSLLIPIPRPNLEALEKALYRIAPFDWVARGSIHIFPLEATNQENVADAICEYCQNNKIQHVLVPKRVHCGETAISEAGFAVIAGPTIVELVHGNGLLRHLSELGLDWRSEVTTRLGHYALGSIGEVEIDRWLAQFERLGNHRAVGEHLLQLIDILPLTELGDSLSVGSDFYGAELVVGFNNDKWGKSWGTVSTLIRKRCASASLFPITEAIEKGGHPKVLRLVEDGLFSGTEMRAILDSLQGKRPPGRSQKVPKLADPTLLSLVSIQVHFGVVCDFGEAMLRKYMATNALPNIQIAVSAAARKLRVLHGSPPPDTVGLGDDDEAFRARLRSRVVPFAFQDDKGWKDAASLARARTFCENVGAQLWQRYLEKKSFDLSAWPENRVKLCALGMEGLGLTFAFPHSVPKASLPLLWARGKVTVHGTSLEWIPLFPNADG